MKISRLRPGADASSVPVHDQPERLSEAHEMLLEFDESLMSGEKYRLCDIIHIDEWNVRNPLGVHRCGRDEQQQSAVTIVSGSVETTEKENGETWR